MNLQSKSILDGKFALLGSSGASGYGSASHCIDSGTPHYPGLPSKESFAKVRNCWACGILPTKQFCQRFMTERNDRAVDSIGISPESRFMIQAAVDFPMMMVFDH